MNGTMILTLDSRFSVDLDVVAAGSP